MAFLFGLACQGVTVTVTCCLWLIEPSVALATST
jgi:hypothetical protein